MTEELAKKQSCVMLISGIELWVDEAIGVSIQKILLSISEHKFITVNGRAINTASISAVLLPEDIEDRKRRQNGQWKCQWGEWHEKGERCGHVDPARTKADEEFYRKNGYYPISR